MIVSAIAAMSKNRVIGKENRLPWHLPQDLKHFKEITLGHTVIMGRKTFQSIGRALPGRRNVVISRQKDFNGPGIQVFDSISEALKSCEGEDEAFIIGGEEIYRLAMPFLDRLYLTVIDQMIEGDAYFPEFSQGSYQETSRQDFQEPFKFSFLELNRAGKKD